MSQKHAKLAGLCCLMFMVRLCSAYDTETHAAITRKAWEQSALASSITGSVLNQLGLDRLDIDTRFNIYWQPSLIQPIGYYTDGVGDGSTYEAWLFPESFEQCQMQEFLNSTIPAEYQIFGDTVDTNSLLTSYAKLPVQNWLVRGTIREDDIGTLTPSFYGQIHCSSQMLASSYGTLARSLNHFFDPYFGDALSPCPFSSCNKSMDWALGYINSLADSPQIDLSRQNFYSYADARNQFWWALTRSISKRPNQLYSEIQRESDAKDRMYLWATAFRSLGDVLHLLEDGAQPQHTRNDVHGGPYASPGQKAFEDYTNDRVLGVNTDINSYIRGFFAELPNTFSPPPLGGYPIVEFATPTRFFTTHNVDQMARAGLADYTNRGFFTGGTLPGSITVHGVSYPQPPSPSTDTSYEVVVVPCPEFISDPRLSAVTCTHYTRAVPDVVAPGYTNVIPGGFLKRKSRAAVIEKNPFLQILS